MTIRPRATYRDGVFIPLPGQLLPDLPEETEVEITVQKRARPKLSTGEAKAAQLREIAASMKANSFTGDPPRVTGQRRPPLPHSRRVHYHHNEVR